MEFTFLLVFYLFQTKSNKKHYLESPLVWFITYNIIYFIIYLLNSLNLLQQINWMYIIQLVIFFYRLVNNEKCVCTQLNWTRIYQKIKHHFYLNEILCQKEIVFLSQVLKYYLYHITMYIYPISNNNYITIIIHKPRNNLKQTTKKRNHKMVFNENVSSAKLGWILDSK